jgi:Fe-S cluster assembly protein SufD
VQIQAADSSSGFLSRLIANPIGTHADPFELKQLRESADERFREIGFPTPETEAWRFTSLKSIIDTPWRLSEGSIDLKAADLKWQLADAYSVVLVNGRFAPQLSTIGALAEGTQVSSLSEAIARNPKTVFAHLGQHVLTEDHAFAAVNTARFDDGAFIQIPDSVALDRPVVIHFVSTAQAEPSVSHPRILVVQGAGSELKLIEVYSGGASSSLTNAVTELVLDSSAVLEHYRICDEASGSNHLAVQHATLGRDSQLATRAFTLDGSLSRVEMSATLTESGADARLNGLSLVDGERHNDFHVTVKHAAPHCTSHQLFKSILDDSSRSVFSGRIVVDQHAQKTDAQQSSRSLLISEDARANSNPQLEIFADDVRCTHGSTIGQLDEEAVFYLRSRGIDLSSARNMLTHAFAGEVIAQVKLEELRDQLEERLSSWLAHRTRSAEVC